MLRQHQFEKVELVHIVRPDESYEALEALTAHAEAILTRLGARLPGGHALHRRHRIRRREDLRHRGVAAGAAALPRDLLVQQLRGVSRRAACGRGGATRRPGRPNSCTPSTASGVAIGRALIAVVESCQRADGSIRVPEALVPYMGGMTEIRGDG